MNQTSDPQIIRKITSISTTTILKIVGVFLALYFLYLIRDILLLLLISVLLASALNPLVEWLYARLKFPRGLTVVLVYILFLGVVVLILSLIIPQLISESSNLGSNLQNFRHTFDQGGSVITGTLERFGLSNFLQTIGNSVTSFTSGLFQKTLGALYGIFDVITVLVISFYLVIQQDGMKDFLKSLTPLAYHRAISSVVAKAQSKLGSWLLGELALMTSIFVMMFVALSLLHVPYALSLALLAGLLEVVPYLGPIVSVIPGVFVASLQSPTLAIVVLIVYWAVQQIENYFLVPRIIGKSIGANPLVVLIALLIGFKIAGIVGVLISVPLVAVGSVILDEYRYYRKIETDSTSASFSHMGEG